MTLSLNPLHIADITKKTKGILLLTSKVIIIYHHYCHSVMHKKVREITRQKTCLLTEYIKSKH